jgi:hypothetical protein
VLLELELLEDPQPVASTSAEHAIRTGMPFLIGRSFLGRALDST